MDRILSLAGEAILGKPGLILVTIAAAFSTASAINATLFSTSRLIENIANKNDLPQSFAKENKNKIPYAGMISVGVCAAALAMLGSLSSLVNATSLIFLFTFGVVNFVAFNSYVPNRWLCLMGVIGSGIAILANSIEQFHKNPGAMIFLITVVAIAVFARPYLLKLMK